MPRVIRYFDKETECYIGEVVLQNVSLGLLQKAFEVSAENPMYDSYPIRKSHMEFLNKYLNLKFEFNQFEYFLEYDA